MGSVWEARHETLGLRVAIKFIEKEYADSKEARSRFDNEAKAAAKIQSKHLIKIFDHGVTPDGKPYIVMELLEGEPLDKRLERLGRLPLQDVARILQQVARGLARAHAAHIIHRDLKPENIFLTQSTDDDEEVAKVLDFGIAKIRSTDQTLSNSTKTGAVLGTPYYMSPEQARGLRDIDHRTDVWSLGVIVFKCATGVLPFEGESLGDLLVKICTAPLPVPSHVLPGLPPSFDAWFARVLDREPARRFSTVTEAAEGLAYLCGVTVRRGPTSGASREIDPASMYRPSSPSSPSHPGGEGYPRTVPSAPPGTAPQAGPGAPAHAFTPPAYAQLQGTTPHPTPPQQYRSPSSPSYPAQGSGPTPTTPGFAASTPRGPKSSSVSLILGIVVGVVATIVLAIVAFRVSPGTQDKAKAAAMGGHRPATTTASASATASESAAALSTLTPSSNEVAPATEGETPKAATTPSTKTGRRVGKTDKADKPDKGDKTDKPSSSSTPPTGSASASSTVKPTPPHPSPPGKQPDDNPGY